MERYRSVSIIFQHEFFFFYVKLSDTFTSRLEVKKDFTYGPFNLMVPIIFNNVSFGTHVCKPFTVQFASI